MNDFADRPIPKPVFGAVAAVVGATLLLTGSVALGLFDRPATPSQVRAQAGIAQVASRSLVFTDRDDGALLITEPGAPAPVAIVEANSNQGFVRGVVRSMSRERRMRNVAPTEPYDLALWADGRLTLADPSTGRTVELDSFGATNREAFRVLLPETRP